MESNYTKLIATLRECFMLDQADLDFGIYRIMNSRRTEIETFLEKDLIPQVKTILASAWTLDKGILERELTEAINSAKILWADPESLPKVREIRAKLADSNDLTALENEVFSHLANFFRRYFDAGDFISMRRYKKDVYAIPYEGEEVKLHWANADQYYIKTSEYFKNYRFKINDDKAIFFTLVEASTEQNNNKSQWDKERKFKLYIPGKNADEEGKPTSSLEVLDGELHIYFTYEPMETWLKQDTLITEAFEKIKSQIPTEFKDGIGLSPTAKNKDRTILEKHLVDYVAKNTFDYFIHKDLWGFLIRELDFYIKNEILYIDDIDSRSPESFIGSFAMIKAVKQIGEKIITFLAQLEEFQKKLFLKKKMVVETGYCITLDRIDEKFYDDIRVNEDQIDDWVALFAIDEIKGFSRPLTKDFLKENPFLVLDTKHFPESWKNKLIGEIENLDESLEGLIINSENFQWINFLANTFRKRLSHVYIDPPYNANSSEILYKNTFKHSSWLSLMYDRILNSKELLTDDSCYVIAIDEVEQERLWQILSILFPTSVKACIPIVHNPRGQQWTNISYVHEFAFLIYPSEGKKYIADVKRSEIDSRNLRDSWTESNREDAATCFYPFLVKDSEIVWVWPVPLDDYHPNSNNIHRDDWILEIWPIDDSWKEKKWRYSNSSVISIMGKLEVKKGRNAFQIIFNKDMATMRSLWADAKYDASEYGTKVLQEILWKSATELFSFPKSIRTLEETLSAIFWINKNWYCMDFFWWSWTTGHAIINLNREDAKDGGEMGKRKYILVEMGEYFNTVTKPRIQKVIYSEDWKDWKPVSRKGSSHAFKYLRLESYEDALNNLVLQKNEIQQAVLDLGDNKAFRESYMLGYMLDTESRGSILSLDHFTHPFDFEMDITKNNETTRTRVDIVETFNYLLGLVVEHSYEARGYRIVKGKTLTGDRVLVVWRDLGKHSNEDLNAFLEKSAYNPLDTEFDRIYVNGDNSVENMKTGEQTWKVLLIEEEFMKKMFEV